MQNFKSFGPLGTELQAPPCPRTRTLLPPFYEKYFWLFTKSVLSNKEYSLAIRQFGNLMIEDLQKNLRLLWILPIFCVFRHPSYRVKNWITVSEPECQWEDPWLNTAATEKIKYFLQQNSLYKIWFNTTLDFLFLERVNKLKTLHSQSHEKLCCYW